MQIAITGATGHIGAALIRTLLRDGHQVRALVRQDIRALEGQNVETVVGNLLDPQAIATLVRGCEVVFHLAARISLDGDRKGEVFQTNVEGTRLVMEACMQASVRRLVHFASVHAFQTPATDEAFNETLPVAGPNHYAYERTKGMAMEEVLAAGKTGRLETIVLCPTGVIGPWDIKPSRQGKMLNDLWNGRMPFIPGGGFNWVDSRDVALAAVSAMTEGQSGEAYLLAGRYATVMEIVTISRSITGKRLPTRRMPDAILNFTAQVMTRWARWTHTEPIVTLEALTHLRTGHPQINYQKAVNAFGYHPRPLEKTLLDTYYWFQNTDQC